MGVDGGGGGGSVGSHPRTRPVELRGIWNGTQVPDGAAFKVGSVGWAADIGVLRYFRIDTLGCCLEATSVTARRARERGDLLLASSIVRNVCHIPLQALGKADSVTGLDTVAS